MSASSLFSSASMPKSMKLKLKGGGYVDPESGLEDKVRKCNVFPCLKTGVCGAQHMLIVQVKRTPHENDFPTKEVPGSFWRFC